MNINNRLEKLEGKVLDGGSLDVCKCPRAFKIVLTDDDRSEEERERERAELQKPLYCEICGKVIQPIVIKIV